LVGKLKGRRSRERPRNRWDYNIKMNIKEMGSEDVDWIRLVQVKVQ